MVSNLLSIGEHFYAEVQQLNLATWPKHFHLGVMMAVGCGLGNMAQVGCGQLRVANAIIENPTS